MAVHENSLQNLRRRLELLEKEISFKKTPSRILENIHPHNKASACNLLQYLSLRKFDIRELQDKLHEKGLSSLASSESHIHRQLQEIMQRVGVRIPAVKLNKCDLHFASNKLHKRSQDLFGLKKDQKQSAIMITLDHSFAEDEHYFIQLLKEGMNVARINCAHDDVTIWKQMIATLQKSCESGNYTCKIYMDLAGPKIRTIIPKSFKKRKIKIQEGDLITISENKIQNESTDLWIKCSLPGIVHQLRIGDCVKFDDGLIEAEVQSMNDSSVILKITRISGKNSFLKHQKGMNFPTSVLNFASLTEFDKQVLPFALKNADLIGCSFIHSECDVKALQELAFSINSDKKKPKFIYKIETPEAVINLPKILLQGLSQKNFGIMIARGDLAVEIGFERLSEIQEEILWICEAAHTPVIWATQVLETLNKSGIATRSEITDAFRSSQAECVMLNKGDYLLEAIKTLKDILTRSRGHHIKKRSMFRPLKIAELYFKL
jgi:pyruvate kinase